MRRIVTLLGVALILWLTAFATVGAAAQERWRGAVDARATAGTEAPPRLRLVSQDPWVGPTGRFSMAVGIDGPPPGARLTFRIYPDASAAGRIHYLQTMRGEQLGQPLRAPYVLPVSNLPTGDDGSVTAAFEVSDERQPFIGFRLPNPGVYPVSVTLETGDGRDVATLMTSLVRLPATSDHSDAHPLALAVVAPVGGPVALQTDGRTALPDDVRAGLTETMDLVSGVPETPLTVAPDPETIDALVTYDRSEGTDHVNRFATSLSRRQVLAGPYVPLDVGSWAASGMDTRLVDQLNLGSETLADRLTVRPDRRTWLVDPTMTPEALLKLKAAGIDQLVIPEEQLTALDSRSFGVTLTRSFEVDVFGQRTRAVMADATLRLHMAATDDPVLNAHQLLGDLAVLYFDQPALRHGAVLTLPDSGRTSPEFLRALLLALKTPVAAGGDAKPVMAAVTLDGLFSYVEPAGQNGGRGLTDGVTRPEPTLVRGWSYNQPVSLATYKTQLGQAERSIDAYRSMVGDAPVRLAPLEALLNVSGARQFDDAQRQSYLDAAVAFVNTQAHAISLPEQQRVTLTSDQADIPLVIDNGLDYPVDVKVTLTSDKLDFTRSGEFTTRLVPGSNRITVPVRPKSSGAFPINVAVSSPDGVLPMASGGVPIRSTAISGLGLALTVGSGLFLGLWWARHFRKTRRSRRLISADNHPTTRADADGQPDAPTGTPASTAAGGARRRASDPSPSV